MAARPNGAHEAIARLGEFGTLSGLVTQNVDELHARAGSRHVLELHGSNHRVVCLDCGDTWSREDHQTRLAVLNPGWTEDVGMIAPDGDAPLDPVKEESFVVADCPMCGGVAKPDVVFFGESVPKDRVSTAMSWVEDSDLLLVVGSSLTVWSGFRFVRAAKENGVPIGIVNIGPTRADDIVDVKVEDRCSRVMTELVRQVR